MDPEEVINVRVDTDINHGGQKFIFKWIVQKIARIPRPVKSTRFSPELGPDKDWLATATVLPNDKFKVSLTCDSKNPIPLTIEHTSRAYNTKLHDLGGKSSGALLFQEQGEEFVLLDEVRCPIDNEEEEFDGNAIFECNMKIYGLGLNMTCTYPIGKGTDYDLAEYQHCLRNLMDDKECSDLDIQVFNEQVSKDEQVYKDEVFKVHKCVLRHRAPLFWERHQEAIATEKLDLFETPIVLKRLLEYIYTGEEPVGDYLELFHLAHEYELPGLKKRCAKAMAIGLSVHTVFDTFFVAEQFKDEQLTLQCRLFMRQNAAKIQSSLQARTQWNNLVKNRPEFLQELKQVHE